MDRAAIEELITFHRIRLAYVRRNDPPFGDDVLTRPAPGSGWPALRDALVHMNWENVRWLTSPVATTNVPVERVNSWKDLDV
jgi:hypothetical protein